MDSFEWNKIFGAVLGTGLLVFALKIVGGGLFHTEAPEKPGFAIATAEAQTADAGKPAAAAVPIADLLAKADASKGEAFAKACAACHDFSKGGGNKVGPALYGVSGRGIGTAPGFAYSDGFKAMAGKNWDDEALNAWLTKPSAYIKGTKMAFAGISKDEDRANVIKYLDSLK